MKNIIVAMLVTCSALLANSVSANIVYSQDFETNSNGFSGGGAVASSEGYAALGFGNQLLHNDGNLASTLTFNLGQAANHASLATSLAIIDSWDDGTYCCGPDQFSVKLDGVQVFAAVFDNYLNKGPTSAAGLTSLSYGTQLGFNGGFNDAAYLLNISLGNLSAGTHTIDFLASGPGWQGGSDESLGIDNVVVSAAPVPEPGSWVLMMVGLIGLYTGLRRRIRH